MEMLFDIVIVLTPLLLLITLILLIIFDNYTKYYFNTKDLKIYSVYKLSSPFVMKGYTFTKIAFDEENEITFISNETLSNDYIKIKGYKNNGGRK